MAVLQMLLIGEVPRKSNEHRKTLTVSPTQ